MEQFRRQCRPLKVESGRVLVCHKQPLTLPYFGSDDEKGENFQNVHEAAILFQLLSFSSLMMVVNIRSRVISCLQLQQGMQSCRTGTVC
jgi:hypothetical protein